MPQHATRPGPTPATARIKVVDENFVIFPQNNGLTFLSAKMGDTITGILPAARKGLSFSFAVGVGSEGFDPIIAEGDDLIYSGGSGTSDTALTTEGVTIKLFCTEDGIWSLEGASSGGGGGFTMRFLEEDEEITLDPSDSGVIVVSSYTGSGHNIVTLPPVDFDNPAQFDFMNGASHITVNVAMGDTIFYVNSPGASSINSDANGQPGYCSYASLIPWRPGDGPFWAVRIKTGNWG